MNVKFRSQFRGFTLSALIPYMPQSSLAPEDPIDAYGVGQDDWHSDTGDYEHVPKCFVRGRGVDDGEAIGWLRHRHHDIGEIGNSKNRHEKNHGKSGHEECPEFITSLDHDTDGDCRSNIQSQDGKSVGSLDHCGDQIGALKDRGDIKGEEKDQKESNEAGDPSLDGGLKFPLGLEHEEDGAVHGKESHDRDAKQQ